MVDRTVARNLIETIEQIKQLAEFLKQIDRRVGSKYKRANIEFLKQVIPPITVGGSRRSWGDEMLIGSPPFKEYSEEIRTVLKQQRISNLSRTVSAWLYDILDEADFDNLNNALIEIGFYTLNK